MKDDNDIHEPEHDHLLDHEFYDEYEAPEPEVGAVSDDDEDEGDDDAWGLLDDADPEDR